MYTRKTTIINKTGLHARPASDFVNAAGKFKSRITIKNITEDEGPMNAKSIIHVLSLGMGPGTEVELSAQGEDEKEAVDFLIELIDSGFGE
ncbi:MAG TPA: HPr family phosphocarrier protein [Clostridiales bacterium]|nr:HPr family phosphocarrier protein [Clostridiales bacterium]